MKLFFVFIFSLSSSLLFSANSDEEVLIDQIPQDNIYVSEGTFIYGQEYLYTANTEAIVYVSSDAILHGASHITKAKIVHIPVAVLAEKVVSIETDKVLGISKEFIATDKKQDTTLKQHQHQSIEKVTNTFFVCAEKQNSTSFFKTNDSTAVVSSSSSTSSFSSVVLVSIFEITIEITEITKQNFYTSPSFVQACIEDASFLRGPPQSA